MDTKPLERFATWARRELINAVDAQATAVLAVGSVARIERAEVIKKLEAEIARHSRQQVVDKVAYTWFNRIIALRFMDARGYTDAGVVSPARGQAHGQPEILSDAKRGNLDTDVVTNARIVNAIIGLLDGTRRSTDAEGEAYALLLTEHCRYWHKPMPFMFEREGDYTELLVPANLLADGAILARAREVLTAEVCDDVEVIGWLYQFYISERKAEVFAGFKQHRKAGADELPAATQLFTPHWIVRYLVENSLGRLWTLNRPASRLVKQMDYYIVPADEETDFLKVSRPEELTVIDPACGSGHMLTYAFDLLYAIYEEEGYAPSEIPGLILTHNLHGTEIDPRAGSLAAFALTMKARAKQRTFFNKQVEPKICVIDPVSFSPDELDFLVTPGGDRHEEESFWNQFEHADTLGSLIQPDRGLTARAESILDDLGHGGDILHSRTLEYARQVVTQAEVLSRTYSVVTANPPYMGSRHMNDRLAAFAKHNFPNAKSDLFAMYIERCVNLTAVYGSTAMITMQSWMFLSSYEALRERLVQNSPVSTMLHLGERGFDSIGGAVVSTTAFVLRRFGDRSRRAAYVRAIDGQNEAAKRATILAAAQMIGADTWHMAAIDLEKLPGAPIAYWLSEDEIRVYLESRPLSHYAETRQGLATGDNDKFLRFWWEVGISGVSTELTSERFISSGLRWVPLQKGGASTRWFGNDEFVISYDKNSQDLLGRQGNRLPSRKFYFREGFTWSSLSKEFSVRQAPAGGIFETKGSMMFFREDQRFDWLLGYLNTSIAQQLMDSISPTLDYHEGPVGRLPVILPRDVELVGEASNRALKLAQSLWVTREIARSFEPPWKNEVLGRNLRTVLRSVRDDACGNEDEIIRLESEIDEEFRNSANLLAESFSAPRKTSTGLLSPQYRLDARADSVLVSDLVSYSVGCMFGRYSLDMPGIILADQGATLQEYLSKISTPMFRPDADNVLPIVDDGWFEDDIAERFRQFLRTAFGVEHFEENLHYVEESLGVTTLRDYFITKAGKSRFYDDHVQRYKKRPIYWMFSSPKGSFNALIYMHRYTPSTVSTVLNEYLREYRAKLEVALANAELAAASGGLAKEQKEADRLRKVLVELAEYEHNVLYPLATQQIVIDLDDGVKANYPKFYPALKGIAGLEAAE